MKTKKIKALCEECGRETNHEALHEHAEGSNEEYCWRTAYQIIKCCGCDTVSFREETITEDDYDPYTGKPDPRIKLYPPRITGRKPVDENYHLPTPLRRIYREVLIALNSSSVILAAVGLRTLIEGVCIDQEVAGRDLEKKIDSLASQGILSEKQAKILHTHRFLGNVAAHEIAAAKPTELVAALDIAETLLKTIYILPEIDKKITTGRRK